MIQVAEMFSTQKGSEGRSTVWSMKNMVGLYLTFKDVVKNNTMRPNRCMA